jgi:predicted DNA-binding protein with PD1-like motif
VRYVEGKTGRVILARLEKGDDLLSSVKRLAEDIKIHAGTWLVMGTLSRAHFYFYRPEPNPLVLEEPLEIVACYGSITLSEGEIRVHGHIDVTDSEFNSRVGHLLEDSIVDAMAFLTIFEVENADPSQVGL